MGKSTLTGVLSKTMLATAAFSSLLASAQVNLRPSLEEEVIDTKIGGRNVFSIGFYADSDVILNRPYTIATGKFAYQVPIGVGFDFAYGLSQKWEMSGSVGYQKFEAKQIGDGFNENFVIGGFTSIPVRLNLRRRWPEKVVAPEMELSVGAAFQKTSIRSTVLNTQAFNDTRVSPYAHLGGGISYAWGNDLTIHFMAGYAAIMNGNKTYEDPSKFKVTANNLVHGVFSKGMVRVQF